MYFNPTINYNTYIKTIVINQAVWIKISVSKYLKYQCERKLSFKFLSKNICHNLCTFAFASQKRFVVHFIQFMMNFCSCIHKIIDKPRKGVTISWPRSNRRNPLFSGLLIACFRMCHPVMERSSLHR